MSSPISAAINPYNTDDFTFANAQNQARHSNNSSHNVGVTELELADAAEALESQNRIDEELQEEYLEEHGLDDLELDVHNLDEFAKLEEEKVSTNYFEEERRRRKRRQVEEIGKTKKISELEQIEQMENFFAYFDVVLGGMDSAINGVEIDQAIENGAFSNWVQAKPQRKKLKPPPRAKHPPLFLREAFKPQRSPHLWKSDPQPWWHLAFGRETNTKVIENLIKYQNNTIEVNA